MSKWTLYRKDNTPTPYQIDRLEYHDTWMGEEYVIINLTSPTPLSFEIGDYLIYRGRKYSIYNVPSALKQARSGSYGEAFKYDNVKLSSYAYELTEVRFLDIVLGDNNLHYTSLPTFSAYCETVDDLVDRLQANTDRERATYTYWYFITPDKQRTLGRIIKWDPTAGEEGKGAWVPDVERQAVAEQIWNEYFKDEAPDIANEKKNVNITVDKASVWDGLSYVKQHFGLNFITNCHSVGRVAVIGASEKHTAHIFQYGKGNGLSQIERIADTEQLVVTKLFAYGSDKNLPYHHYSDLSTRPFLLVTEDYHHSSTDHAISVSLEDVSSVYAFTNIVSEFAGNYYCTFTCMIGNVVCDANAEVLYGSTSATASVRLLIFARGYYSGNPNSKYTTQYNVDSIKTILDNAIASGIPEKVVFMSGTDITKFPNNRRYMLVDGMPNNMSVNCLMLPGFPLYALNDVVKCEYVESEDDYWVDETRFYVRNTPNDNYSSTPLFSIPGNHVFEFSTDQLRPWIKSPNAAELGVKEGDVHFIEESDDNGLQDVHPSIEGMTENDVFHNGSLVRLDEIDSADIITDNGRFAETDTKPDFHVVIRDLGFDLLKAFTDAGSSMKLSMKDGYCGGRDFEVRTVNQLADGKWRLTVKRLPDESLELYFPYSDKAAHYEPAIADEPYQIRGPHTEGGVTVSGDHFVLTDILIQDTNYVHAASIELFRKACLWLASNDYTRFTYLPKIDEIFMARDRENPFSQEYNTIKAGKMMDFTDTDFDIDASIYIDQLTIKEGGNNGIPTYDVTLREDKQVGALQRVQNQINSLNVLVSSSGYTRKQIIDIIQNWVTPRFLSKLSDDIANGIITFAQGIKVGVQRLFGIDDNGDATLHNVTAETADIPEFTTPTTFDEDVVAEKTITAAEAISNFLHTSQFVKESGLAGLGFGVTTDANGKATTQTDDLIVLGNMIVNSLNIREVSYIGGVYLLTPAGSTVQAVIPLYTTDTEHPGDTRLWTTEGSGAPVGYRVLWVADNGTTYTMNYWKQGDQAFCETFNIAEPGQYEHVSNSRYWRMVCKTGQTAYDNKTYHFVDLANTAAVYLYDEEGNAVQNVAGGYVFFGYEDSHGSVPSVDDKVVCLGSQADARRQAAIQLSAEGTGSFGIYDGINNYNPLSTYEVHFMSKDAVRMRASRFSWTTNVGVSKPPTVYCGEWTTGNISEWGYEWTYNGVNWLCIIPQGQTTNEAPGTTPAWWVSNQGESGKTYALGFYTDGEDPTPIIGLSVRPASIDETVKPYLLYGQDDISSNVTAWKWERESNYPALDEAWANSVHTDPDDPTSPLKSVTRTLHITTSDLPTGWDADNGKVGFKCTATFTSGSEQAEIINRISIV